MTIIVQREKMITKIKQLEDTISFLNIRINLVSIAVRLKLGEEVYKHILDVPDDKLLKISEMFEDMFKEAGLIKKPN